jgi:hypothetical protein
VDKGRKIGRATNTPGSNGPYLQKKGPDVILQEFGARLYGQSKEKRGGSGSAGKLDPDPRTTTSLKRKSRVVE